MLLRPRTRALASVTWVTLAAATVGAGCGARTGLEVALAVDGGGGAPACTGAACACGPTAFVGVVTRGAVGKIDLLLALDNSSSMADKQAILALAIPDLIVGLVNPRCLDDVTNAVVANQPMSPLDPCPAGSTRDFTPVLDIHVGMISSSLGSFGADGCQDKPPAQCPSADTTPLDDHGHLVTRSDTCDAQGPVPTYQSLGFLAWDPAQKLSPPGEAAIGDPTATPPVPGLATSLRDLVVGDGQSGCGFESQDESWYRFLVDPTPYGQITMVNNQVQTSGIDSALLQQRKEFLRPDSLLAVVVVSDETDTSIRESSSYPFFAAPEVHLPHARQDCTTKGPLDPCCLSCGETAPLSCAPDLLCESSPNYTSSDEDTGLRAYGLISHKERYGIEFFYQPSRYVNALTSPTVKDASGNVVPNPIYANLDPTHDPGAVRDATLVYYAAVVGVPWQLIARQKNGVPDLVNGVSALDPSQVGGFKTSRELALTDALGNTFWDDIVGDPEHYVAARSPFMQEATSPRSGTDPITGAAIAPPTTQNGEGPMVGGSLVNDHEFTIASPPGFIEYACVFPLLAPIDEGAQGDPTLGDCGGRPDNDNPLCSPNPNDGMQRTLQTKAKAYPGLKELAIAKGMGDQGIAASICAKQLTDSSASDFGYRPAVSALLDRLSSTLGEQCLARQLTPDATGRVACSVIEARHTGSAGCTCDEAALRSVVPAADACYVDVARADPRNQTADWDCFCEIAEAAGSDLHACQSEVGATGANGWCYVDPAATPPVGNPALVKGCPEGDKRVVRFVGSGTPASGSTIFIGCK
jgi:hypothetical protein